eukprot:scaffold11615_cov15-Phaeocystis_antarctica.AAC.1
MTTPPTRSATRAARCISSACRRGRTQTGRAAPHPHGGSGRSAPAPPSCRKSGCRPPAPRSHRSSPACAPRD